MPLTTSDGYRIDGLIQEVTPTEVILDFNHPLAKDKVHYAGEVTLVREPTAEELKPANGCGCGCGCGCDDDCGDSCDGEGACGCGGCGCK